MTKEVRFTASAFFFAAALLTSAALIFLYGTLGLRGNSTITGGYLLITIVSVILLGREKSGIPKMTAMDTAFVVLFAAIAVSIALHFDASDYKEYLLLTLNFLLAY